MKKDTVLEIEFKEVWDNKWAWKIIKNEGYSEANNNLGVNVKREGIFLYDYSCCCWKKLEEDTLINTKLKESIEKIVKLINEKYGTSKRWRAKNREIYYIINDIGYIISCTENFTQTDSTYYNLGNYFKSAEAAIKFRDTVWKDLWIQRKETYKE